MQIFTIMYRDDDGDDIEIGFGRYSYSSLALAQLAARQYLARELGIDASSLTEMPSAIESGGITAIVNGDRAGGFYAEIIASELVL